ncbi:MAG: DUF3987 domain-containing protein [Deltaproteobacteria bacterium]|nr:DUF3987 domain-containing protein [Deltaproteobacteria bacterium]
MLCLASVAVGAARKIRIEIIGTYREPLNIYVVVVLPPANRKSAVFRHVTEPIRDLESCLVEAARPRIEAAKVEREIKQKKLEKLKADAAGKKGADPDQSAEEAKQIAQELVFEKVEALPQFLADDTTPEKLCTIIFQQGERIGVFSPEGGIFELLAGRYQDKIPNLDLILKGHAGDSYRVDRVSREGEFLRSPAITFGLTVQPDVLRSMHDKPGFRGRGLLGRFLYSLPKSPVGHRQVDPVPANPAVLARFEECLVNILRLEGGDPSEDPPALKLSSGAYARWLEFAKTVEPTLGEGGNLFAIQDWAGKFAGAVARIAGLLHVADHAGGTHPLSEKVGEGVMQRAAEIGEYLLAHALVAFEQMGADPDVEAAKTVLRTIERKGLRSFTKRDLFEWLKGRFRRVDQLAPALKILGEHNFLRERPPEPRGGPGRPSSAVIDVNPALRAERWEEGPSDSHNSQNAGSAAPEPTQADFEDSANYAAAGEVIEVDL